MVTVRLKGNQGNQMFQYAAGKALAARLKTDIQLDLTLLFDRIPRKNYIYGTYGLHVFGLSPKWTVLSKIERAIRISGIFLGASLFLTYLKRFLGGQVFLHQIRDSIDQRKLTGMDLKGKDVYLNGYWISEKYFKAIEGEIRKDFTYRRKVSEKAREMEERILSANAVCLNVRRGDYVNNPKTRSTTEFVGLEYFKKAVNLMTDKVKDPKFFVFSNDLPWCKENLDFIKYPVEFVEREYGGENYYDYFYLMTKCKHFIIPNSTFAWWAAWLGGSDDKVVVAPLNWFASRTEPDRNDVIPDNWIRL